MQIVDVLKRKAIEQYNIFLKKAKNGYRENYQYILALISFINMPIQLDNSDYIKQRLLNYGITDYLHLGK